MRIAVFGGSFDPPHMGHAMVAQWVLLTGQADEVWFTPAFSHPLKDRVLSPWEDRCKWVELFAREMDARRCTCCTIEDTLSQPSYMIHTLEALVAYRPDREYRLVIGSDILSQSYRWHRWEDIQAKFNPIVANRASHKLPYKPPVFPNINSSEIRRVLGRRQKEPLINLVPKCVLDVLPCGAYWSRGS
jgi:nicotinate-nucleotide adenylyltransferase